MNNQILHSSKPRHEGFFNPLYVHVVLKIGIFSYLLRFYMHCHLC